MLFVGIDLAWSYKNGSGIAVVKGNRTRGKLIAYGIVHSDEEILDYVRSSVDKGNAFIAIDAPLLVPNRKGRRIAEEKVGELFRKYDAGAHPANRERLGSWSDGRIRGEELSKLLKKERFVHSPLIKRYESKRKFFEVYPHPSMVVLFGLNKILRYKAKPKRDYAFRYVEFRKYQRRLSGLSRGSPALGIPAEVVGKDVRKLRGRKLKDYEDVLDGIFCAYIAYYAWAHPEKCAVLGDMKGGYILTPVADLMVRKRRSSRNA